MRTPKITFYWYFLFFFCFCATKFKSKLFHLAPKEKKLTTVLLLICICGVCSISWNIWWTVRYNRVSREVVVFVFSCSDRTADKRPLVRKKDCFERTNKWYFSAAIWRFNFGLFPDESGQKSPLSPPTAHRMTLIILISWLVRAGIHSYIYISISKCAV